MPDGAALGPLCSSDWWKHSSTTQHYQQGPKGSSPTLGVLGEAVAVVVVVVAVAAAEVVEVEVSGGKRRSSISGCGIC